MVWKMHSIFLLVQGEDDEGPFSEGLNDHGPLLVSGNASGSHVAN